MADPKEVAQLLKGLIGGVGGAVTQAAQNTVPGRPDLVPLGPDQAVDKLGLIYEYDAETKTWTHYGDSGSLTESQRDLLFGGAGGNVQMIGSATGGYYQYDPQTGQWNLAIGGTGTGGAAADPLVAELRQQQIAASQAQEARAQEMQPYDIANVQSTIQSRQAQDEYNAQNLQRQTLSDQFTRANDAFQASYLADQLASEKKKTATSLLTSIVDSLVPAGQTSLPGIPGSTVPIVGTINWNNITTGLDPQTDAAVKYLLQFQQQNRGGV